MRGAFTTFGGPCLQMSPLRRSASQGWPLFALQVTLHDQVAFTTIRKPAMAALCLQMTLHDQVALTTFRMPRCKNGLRCLGVYSPIRRPWHFLKKHAYIHAYLHCLSLVNYRNQGTVLKFNLVPFWKEVSCCSGKQISEKPKCGQL